MLENDENIVPPRSREEHIKALVKDVQTAEDEIATFRDHIRDVKKTYVDNGWLEKEEVQLAIKAYKQLKGNLELDDVVEYAKIIKDVVN